MTLSLPSRRLVLSLIGWAVASGLLAWAIAGRWAELWAAAGRLRLGRAALTIALLIVALAARGEAWLGCIRGAGGAVDRRRVYRATGLGCAANVLSSHLGTAARITVLRRSAPTETPTVGPLLAAEVPI